uniref:peamaclein-like n=1 Tax=Erigeron canadensis TaxID=72917 RepID=UPI001CB9D1CD|nr:peamaclein-like [Erigeron canadensis]
MRQLPFAALLIATLLLISSVSAIESPAPSPASGLGCDGKCENRCARSGWKDRCLKYCGICCGKCNGCVPSSPYADKTECPCYRDLKNPKGKDKCP